jgi:hypothetical protein
MRTLIALTTMLAACGGSGASVKSERLAYDPEMAEACVPEWQQAPPAACAADEEGRMVLKDDDPSFRSVAQILALEKDSHGSVSMDEALVKLTSAVVRDDKASECGRQVCRWHRALAFYRLGRWKQAFIDFGAVVKDGPNSPFYKDVGAWIGKLEPHLPEGAVIGCLANYQAPTPSERVEGQDAHWKPYTKTDPAP